jgi:hypothetical protein
LLGSRTRDDGPLRPRFLAEALATEVPLLLVEIEDGRKNIRLGDFGKYGRFWTVHGYVFRAAEGFLRELETAASLRAIDGAVGGAGLSLPEGSVLCGDYADHPLRDLIFANREPIEVRVNHAQRRIDVLWGTVDETRGPQWIRFNAPRDMTRRVSTGTRATLSRMLSSEIWIPKGDLDFVGAGDEDILYADGRALIRRGSALASFFKRIVELIEKDALSVAQLNAVGELILILEMFWNVETRDPEHIGKEVTRFYEDRGRYLSSLIAEETVRIVALESSGQSFDPEAWSRQLQEREKSG